jgi:hypothetical protein
MHRGESHSIRLAAASAILDRSCGRPAAALKVDDAGGELTVPFKTIVEQ